MKSDTKNKKENGMNPAIIGKAIDLFKSVSDLTQKAIDAGDPEKYAKSVDELNKGVSDSYNTMRKIIMESDKFSDDEKLERLAKLAEQEEESKRKCGEAIKGNREHVAGIALEITKGLLTCGVSFVPAIAKNMKASLNDESKIVDADAQLLLEESNQAESKKRGLFGKFKK